MLPAAAFAGMVLSAADEALGPGDHTLEDMSFEKALFLPEQGARAVQLVLSARGVGETSSGSSARKQRTQQDASWTLHAAGMIRHHYSQDNGHAGPAVGLPNLLRTSWCGAGDRRRRRSVRGAARAGLEYGTSFRGVEQLWRRDGEALGRLRLRGGGPQRIGHKIHPALLDACFQVLAAALPKESADGEDLFLPVGLARLHLDDLPDDGLWAHALLKSDADADYSKATCSCSTREGRSCWKPPTSPPAPRTRCRPENEQEDLDDWLYEVRWEPKELEAPGPRPSTSVRAGSLRRRRRGRAGTPEISGRARRSQRPGLPW